MDHDTAAAMEQELAARADLILAASPVLAARFPGRKTRLLEHGVDIDLFSNPAARAADLPEGEPVAGFYGSLSEWLDVELLEQVARLLPQWRFVLIGPVQTGLGALPALPNVSLLGPRAHADLASYSQHWTAGMMPFRDTPQIRACNPLKLREYLAAGRPVVATPFPALRPYKQDLSIAQGPAAFAAALEAARTDTADRARARRAAVAGEDWSARAELAANWIDALA